MNLKLDYHGYEANLVMQRTHLGGMQYVFKFKNNYGASVVKCPGSYGSERDLWEVAIVRFTGNDWDFCDDNPVSKNPVGYLTDWQVRNMLYILRGLKVK